VRNIASLREAKVHGLTRYFTGKPCKHGHVTERYTVDRHCVDCQSQKFKGDQERWRKANPGYHARWREACPEYGSWANMIARCENPNATGFEYGGGRGITVCKRWRNSYADFLADMGPRPSPKHSIDRIDVDGNYEPNNCRWATSAEQNKNKRRLAINTPNTVLQI
jgi:hypothetical protein